MKHIVLFWCFNFAVSLAVSGQDNAPTAKQQKAITALIGQYSSAREKSDTVLLKTILTRDVDQLVSSGEWRNGMAAAVSGMLTSSSNTPGTRILSVEKIKMLDKHSAIVDCRYEIQNKDGSTKKMWSSFVVVAHHKTWKITAIRNMLPSGS